MTDGAEMMIVVDASVAASWLFPDERNAEGDAILARLQDGDALVPTLWWYEIYNVMILGERRGRTTPEQTAQFLAFLKGLRIKFAPLRDDSPVMSLARRHRLSAYDAAYLELALVEHLPLATFDRELQRAAAAEGVALIGA